MTIYSLEEILSVASTSVPFFRERNSSKVTTLESLPILDHGAYWKEAALNPRNVLSRNPEGLVFKSGGTSGAPKFSFFSSGEWQTFAEEFGWGMSRNVLLSRDRIGNLFYAGDLYASFLFIFCSLHFSGKSHLQLPISGASDPEKIFESLRFFDANVICGVPTTLLAFAEFLESKNLSLPLEKILYGGEKLYPDQAEQLKKVFPKAKINSIGYASVDGGLLGYVGARSEGAIHNSFGRATIMEIVDEEGRSIEEVGREGRLLLTNLTRTLMPILRYPVGDRARWVDAPGSPDRAFEILGRSEEGARIGPVTLFYEDMLSIVRRVLQPLKLLGMQFEIYHSGGRDGLQLRLAVHDVEANTLKDKRVGILGSILQERRELLDCLNKKLVHEPKIEFCHIRDLKTNERTGKLARVVDRR